MAVRVVENFWTKYYEHKDLIERCFHYLFCRFPNPDGEKDAYSILLTRFFELNVFEKFNRKRLIAKKLGVHKKQLDKIDARGYTDRKLHKMGIDVDKKFEQFIFKYVEHILQEAYAQRQKHMVRFIPNQYLAENPPRNHTALYDSLNESVWAQSRKETEDLRIHIEKKARLGRPNFIRVISRQLTMWVLNRTMPWRLWRLKSYRIKYGRSYRIKSAVFSIWLWRDSKVRT